MLSKEHLIKAARTAIGVISVAGVTNTVNTQEYLVFADSGPTVEVIYPREGIVLDSLHVGVNWSPFFLKNLDVTQMDIRLSPNNKIGLGIAAYSVGNYFFGPNVFGINPPRIRQFPNEQSATNCIALPDKSYNWKLRASDAQFQIDPNSDDHWGPWSEVNFRTAKRTSDKISAVEPANQTDSLFIMNTLTPTLRWENPNLFKGISDVFYYEIQLSRDPNFESDPKKATAPLYWENINGCETNPINSYTVSDKYKLDPDSVYYWRLRPRVQPDGQEVNWSEVFRFKTR